MVKSYTCLCPNGASGNCQGTSGTAISNGTFTKFYGFKTPTAGLPPPLPNGEPLDFVQGDLSFAWGSAQPSPFVPADGFMVISTGFLTSKITGMYQLVVEAKGYIRLYLQGMLVIDKWNNTLQGTFETKAYFIDSVSYSAIRLEYYHDVGNATLRLSLRQVGSNVTIQPVLLNFVPLQHCSGICQNGGTCVKWVNRGICYCPAGWTGDLCQERYCGTGDVLYGSTTLKGVLVLNHTLTASNLIPATPPQSVFVLSVPTLNETSTSTPKFGRSYTGFLNVTTAGTYNFSIGADDTYRLFINGANVSQRLTSSSALTFYQTALSIGLTSFRIEHINLGNSGLLDFKTVGSNSLTFGYHNTTDPFAWTSNPAQAVPCSCRSTHYGNHCQLAYCAKNVNGFINLEIYESSSSVVIKIVDGCTPSTTPITPIKYSLTRDGSTLEPSPTAASSLVDTDVQFLKEYQPGATFRYCARYLTSAEYTFLNGGEFCETFVVPWVGTLKGRVKSKPNSVGTQAGIAGVSICAWLKGAYLEKRPSFQCTRTNADGTYLLQIAQPFSGDLQELVILPTFLDHLFTTSDFGSLLGKDYSLSYRGEVSADFIDVSTISLTGVVRVLDSTCGVGQVSVISEHLEVAKTDDMGRFALALTIGASPLISFALRYENQTESDHIFDPPQLQLPQLLADYEIPLTIRDLTTREVEVGAVVGGACQVPVASGPMSYAVRDCSFSFPPFELPGVDARRRIKVRLPAHRVKLFVEKSRLRPAENVDPVEVISFLEATKQASQSLDLRFEAATHSLRFFSPARLEVLSMPSAIPFTVAGCTRQHLGVDGVVAAGAPTSLLFRVYETYRLARCFSTNGTVSVTDFVSSPSSSDPVTSSLTLDSSPVYRHVLEPRGPNIIAPFTKALELTVVVGYTILETTGTLRTAKRLEVAVLGLSSPQGSFIARTSRLPILILRDPPGGSSYTELTKGSSVTTSFSYDRSVASKWDIEGKFGVGIGLGTSIGFGVTVNNEIEVVLGFSAGLETVMATESSQILEFTVEAAETIRTSEAIGLPGKKGDVLMGFAMIVQTGVAYELRVVPDAPRTCRFEISPQISTSPLSDAEDTLYIYSHHFIEATQIPGLRLAISLAEDAKTKEQLQKDLSQWEAILHFKEEQYQQAVSLFSGENSTLVQAYKEFEARGNLFFSRLNSNWVYHNLNHPGAVEIAALAELAVAFVGSVNVLGSIASAGILALTLPLTLDTFINSDPEILHQQLRTLKALFEGAKGDLRNHLYLKGSSKTISFDGGSGGYDQTLTTTKNAGLSLLRTLSRGNKMGLPESSFSGSVFGFGSSSESTAHLSTETAWAQGSSFANATSSTISFHLGDPNPGDAFVVDIFEDPFYGMPVFKVNGASRTSCPWEPNTIPVEIPSLSISPSRLEGVPANEAGIFKISVSNSSPDTVDLNFFALIQTLGDLKLTLNGNPFIGESYMINTGNFEPVELTLEARKGTGRVYENVQLSLGSACETALGGDAPMESVFLSISFLPECFPIEWHPSFLPLAPITLQNGKARLAALAPNYHEGAEEDLIKVDFLFRRQGDFNWQIATTVLGRPGLTSRSYSSEWTVPGNLDDGEYELMILASCNSTQSQSPLISLLVDLTPFETFGIVSPVDRPLKKGEGVSVLFNKELDCPKLLANVSGATNSSLSLKVSCQENRVQILLASASHDTLQGTDLLINLGARSLSGYSLTQSLRIDTEFDECLSNPCQNGGTCVNTPESFFCQCTKLYTGTDCKNAVPPPVILTFGTGPSPLAGTRDQVSVMLLGSKKNTSFYPLEQEFGVNSVVKISFPQQSDIGELEGMVVKISSDDSWHLLSLAVDVKNRPMMNYAVDQWLTTSDCSSKTILVDFCTPNPCPSGSTCTTSPSFSCLCPTGTTWTGFSCKAN